MKYQAVLFAVDGDMVFDAMDSDSVEEVWEQINNWGSRWCFYPICTVAEESNEKEENKIVSCPPGFEQYEGMTILEVQKLLQNQTKEEKEELIEYLEK